MNSFRGAAVLAALVLALAACSSTPSRSSLSPEEAVRERAQTRWEHMIAGEFAQAWDYFTPGYRSTQPREIWAANMGGTRTVRWTGARAGDVTCSDGLDYCDVTVSLDVVTRMPIAGVGEMKATAPVIERWLSVGGNWYFVPKEVTLAQ